jgi:hypothetical protein
VREIVIDVVGGVKGSDVNSWTKEGADGHVVLQTVEVQTIDLSPFLFGIQIERHAKMMGISLRTGLSWEQ